MVRLSLLMLCLIGCKIDSKTIIENDPDVDTDTDTDTDTEAVDADGDGHDVDSDCDDSDSAIHPGAEEVCDGIDSNCDGDVDAGLATFTDTHGTSADWSSTLSAGTINNPTSAELREEGTLRLCDDTWYVSLDISASVEVIGIHGQDAVILHGGDKKSVVRITEAGISVTLEDLRLTNGAATTIVGEYKRTTGGGVFCSEDALSTDVTLSNVTVTSSTAAQAAGIFAAEGCALSLESVTVSDNQATYTGGGIYALGELTLSDVIVSSNTAAAGGGGGVYKSGAGTVSLSEVTISGNTAGGSGGGISINDGATLSADVATITGNNSSGYGGGVWLRDVEVTGFDGAELTSNDAASGGGGLAVQSSALSMSDADFTKNTTSGSGGALYAGWGGDTLSISQGTISSNTAATSGGGLYSSQTPIVLVDVTMSDNHATDAGSYGGAIHALYETVTISGVSTISSNSAGEGGGGIRMRFGSVDIRDAVLEDNTSADWCGALCITDSDAVSTVESTDFIDNTAVTSGGACTINDAEVDFSSVAFSGSSPHDLYNYSNTTAYASSDLGATFSCDAQGCR